MMAIKLISCSQRILQSNVLRVVLLQKQELRKKTMYRTGHSWLTH